MIYGNILPLFDQIKNYWNPKIVANLNGQDLRIAKVLGEFDWHSHENEDELFFVLKGELEIEMRTETIRLQEMHFALVPKGTEHRPKAKVETWIMLFEPSTTINTGNTVTNYTQTKLENLP